MKKLLTLIREETNNIEGGKGDNTSEQSLDKNQLIVGILVELEHTKDIDSAEEIATDHLTEDSKYYTKLIDANIVDEPTALKVHKIIYGDK